MNQAVKRNALLPFGLILKKNVFGDGNENIKDTCAELHGVVRKRCAR
jgi:hypothetical protein